MVSGAAAARGVTPTLEVLVVSVECPPRNALQCTSASAAPRVGEQRQR